MSPTSGQDYRVIPRVGKAAISRVAVALNGAAKVGRNDLLQARSGSAGGPVIKDFAPRPTAGPQIALFGLAVSGFQVVDRCFIHLHITVGEHTGANVFVDGLQPVGRQFHPARQGLAR